MNNNNQWPHEIPLPLDFLSENGQPTYGNNMPKNPILGASPSHLQSPITPSDGIPMPINAPAPQLQSPITPPDGIPIPINPLQKSPDHMVVQQKTVVVATNLSKFVENTPGVKQVSFKLQTGELTAITGEYDDGTTALLRLLALEDKATTGSLAICNNETVTLNQQERSDFQQTHITYIRQSHVGLSEQTGHLLVAYWIHYFEDIMWNDAKALARQALKNVDISYARGDNRFCDLTPYEQARVHVAKACVRSKRRHTLYLFDDLFVSLNEKEALDLITLLSGIARQEKAIVALINRTDVISRFDHVLEMKNESLLSDRNGHHS